MRIVLDAMGSDNAPAPDVEGGVRAARRFGQEIILVGQRPAIEAELAKHDILGLPLTIVHASEVIGMDEHPSQAARSKKDSSMVVGMGLLRAGRADAFVSMGNSGGVLATALTSAGRIGRIPGVKRPAISTVLPTLDGLAFMLDIGANADCHPEWLAQFALLGSVYARKVLGIANPRVGILANGEEETKGNKLVQEAHPLLRALDINYVGNVEGKDLTAGLADVIVSDGFTGNVAVKTAEGTAKMLLATLKKEIKARPLAMVGALLAQGAFAATAKKLDYREYGGAPLLGVDGVVIIGHGRSDALAVENAVRVAIEAVKADLIRTIREDFQTALAQAGEAETDA
jgi:glycerol-3-phosphate acyltransferase PlsX